MILWPWLHRGDSREVLADMPTGLAHALVCDPPAGIGFMAGTLEWDTSKGGRDRWVQWLTGIMREALRVCRPGAPALVWAFPRTSHWTACALESAGWEVLDVAVHVTGSGFPAGSCPVSKVIDRIKGAQREIVGRETARHRVGPQMRQRSDPGGTDRWTMAIYGGPVTAEAERWDGWGSKLSPASEHWIVAKAPGEMKRTQLRRFCYSPKVIARDPYNTHPTVKHARLMAQLVEMVTDPGEVVLDPFMGSGSTGVACAQLGRRFVGIELDPEHHRTAVRRLAAGPNNRPKTKRPKRQKQARTVIKNKSTGVL